MVNIIRIFVLYTLFTSGIAHASLIDLNDFFADSTVSVSLDGASATLNEDPSFSSVVLSNDPGLGDQNVIIPLDFSMLSFDYLFSEGIGEDDEFVAFILDGNTGLSVGPSFKFFTDSSSSGTISIDLSTLVGSFIGFQFELNSLAGDTDFTSSVQVSNLMITQSLPVPAPGSLPLFLSGLILFIRLKS